MAGPRPTWNGTISFGMISLPIKLYSAVNAAETISFRQINKKTGNRVRQPKVDEVTEEPVESNDIAKGYEYEKDKFVLLDQEEIDALTPDRSSSIELITFIDEGEIDSIYFDTPYHIGAGTGGEKPYKLLDQALRKKGKVAIGKFVMRSKEYLCAIRPIGEEGISISTLRWHNQVRDNSNIVPEVPEGVEISDKEILMAGQLIDAMSEDDFDISTLKDTYTEELRELIEQKAQGKLVTPASVSEDVEEDLPDDLFSALEASLEAKTKEAKAV